MPRVQGCSMETQHSWWDLEAGSRAVTSPIQGALVLGGAGEEPHTVRLLEVAVELSQTVGSFSLHPRLLPQAESFVPAAPWDF